MVKKTILLAHQENAFCNEFISHVNSIEELELISVCHDGRSTINKIMELKPNLVVIDSVLPQRDGIGVLEGMRELNITETLSIMVSYMGSEVMLRLAEKAGVLCYLVKPFAMEVLIAKIKTVLFSPSNMKYKRKINVGNNVVLTISKSRRNADIGLTRILTLLGISPHLKGFSHIREAVILCLQDKTMLDSFSRKLYPAIAIKKCATPANIERTIRTAIENAWCNGHNEFWDEDLRFETIQKK